MKEYPILFSGEMVRAILDGRKTRTRRVILPQPVSTQRGRPWESMEDLLRKCPYGQPGDRLWLREAYVIKKWRKVYHVPPFPPLVELTGFWVADNAPFCIVLTTDESKKFLRWKRKTGKRGGIYCFRSLSRITLEIVSVRVQRVQEITDQDAMLEGGYEWNYGFCHARETGTHQTPRDSFAFLWDSINAHRGYGWDVNPYVWVIEFKRIESEVQK